MIPNPFADYDAPISPAILIWRDAENKAYAGFAPLPAPITVNHCHDQETAEELIITRIVKAIQQAMLTLSDDEPEVEPKWLENCTEHEKKLIWQVLEAGITCKKAMVSEIRRAT